jgi:hypothetical protein
MSTKTQNKSLLSLALKKEVTTIRKVFDKNELVKLREEVSDDAIKLNVEEEEFNVVKDAYKTRIKPLKTRFANNLKLINNGFVDVKMEVSLVPDDEKGLIEYMDEDGTVVGSRPMTHEERGSIVFPNN